jgi:prolyl-tRNA synthetase
MADLGPQTPARLIVAMVRGDMDVNLTQALNLSGARALRPALPEEIAAACATPGYGSPIGIDRERALVIVDDLVAQSTNLVAGANEPDYHLLNVNSGRDYQPDIVAPIAQAYAGASCVQCGGALRLERGVEVGNIFQLGVRYTAALGATYTAEDGSAQPIVMGSYGIGLGRLLACIAEEYHDERGLIWPLAVAPYQVALTALVRDEPTRQAADALYDGLREAEIETLYDDREVSPGIKFADADLRGLPLRLTISERSLAADGVELKRRTKGDVRLVSLPDAISATIAELAALRDEQSVRLAHAPVWGQPQPTTPGSSDSSTGLLQIAGVS